MIDILIEPDVFNDAYLPYLDCHARVQIFYGGSGSGKSVFLAQRCVYDLMQGGRNYLIAREVGRTIRRSVFNEIQKVISAWNVASLFHVNKTDATITCINGYQILFTGLDDPEKVKSITPAKGVITDIWIEEATETSRQSVKSLLKRQRGGSGDVPKRLTLSFNPILKTHWIYQEYFSQIAWADDQTEHVADDLTILKTWYVHNRWLTEEDVNDLLSERDEYYRDVYTFGNWGVLGNLIFTNWRVEDLTPIRAQFDNYRNGLDFGFSSDPAAVVCAHYDVARKRLYVFDELYERGLTNDVLATEVKRMIGQQVIVCDSAEPKSIAELNGHYVNAEPAAKGRDSVLHGVQWLQQQEIVVDTQCIDMRNELQLYQWDKDKDGNAIRRPVDRHNHLIDALRYAVERDAQPSYGMVARYA